ncbi:hypothetical protein VNO78_33189 [Psophocarpus tetragonolobus]|uniref:Uncharacterized protein n=1 Tax=Psophocarpus tetragonolobus TaxID=3891 RepID=A0AAN9RPY8_PSOTE
MEKVDGVNSEHRAIFYRGINLSSIETLNAYQVKINLRLGLFQEEVERDHGLARFFFLSPHIPSNKSSQCNVKMVSERGAMDNVHVETEDGIVDHELGRLRAETSLCTDHAKVVVEGHVAFVHTRVVSKGLEAFGVDDHAGFVWIMQGMVCLIQDASHNVNFGVLDQVVCHVGDANFSGDFDHVRLLDHAESHDLDLVNELSVLP